MDFHGLLQESFYFLLLISCHIEIQFSYRLKASLELSQWAQVYSFTVSSYEKRHDGPTDLYFSNYLTCLLFIISTNLDLWFLQLE
jgi:hypothetical protein